MKLSKRLKRAKKDYLRACKQERAHTRNGDYESGEAWFEISVALLTTVKFYRALVKAAQ